MPYQLFASQFTEIITRRQNLQRKCTTQCQRLSIHTTTECLIYTLRERFSPYLANEPKNKYARIYIRMFGKFCNDCSFCKRIVLLNNKTLTRSKFSISANQITMSTNSIATLVEHKRTILLLSKLKCVHQEET